MANISINNGNSYCSAETALAEKDWDLIVSFMDDKIREKVHSELAPCTEQEFLTRYLELAEEDLIIG
jgi:homoserine kinase